MTVLEHVRSPQLEKLHAGKVRDSFRIDAERRLIVVTDRISAFDLKLKTPIRQKGEVLNRLAAFWFAKTADIIPNHLVSVLTEQASIVREATPIRVEMVVRGYMAGSMARGYAEGKRVFSGVVVPEGLRENEKLPTPIVTPTTKEESDREITPEDLVREGFVEKALYEKMHAVALSLFQRGTEVLAERGLVLADTKYELGLIDGQLVLIDEIHTPDSSRIWDAKRHAESPKDVPPLDKEFVRIYMLKEREKTGQFPLVLPADVLEETRARYVELFRRVTSLEPSNAPDPAARLYEALVAEEHIRPGFVTVVAAREADLGHVRHLRGILERHGVRTFARMFSPHENGERIGDLADAYSGSLEPGAVIAIGGAENGLAATLAANLDLPVIASPHVEGTRGVVVHGASPFVRAETPEGAALAALRSLNLRSLRARFTVDQNATKEALLRADRALSEES